MINDKWNLRHKAEIFFFVFKQMQTGDSWQETNQYRVSIYFAFAFIYIHINPRAYLYRMFREYLNNGNSSSSFFSCTPSVNPLRQRPVPSVFCFFFACAKSERKMKIVVEKWKVIISVGVCGWHVSVWGTLNAFPRSDVKLCALMQCKVFRPHFPPIFVGNFQFMLHTFAAHFNWAIAIQNLCQSLWRNGLSLLAPSRCQFARWCNLFYFISFSLTSTSFATMKLALEICMHACCSLFFFILSHYQPHSIGIFISAYFAFNLVTCKLRTRSELFQNIGRLEHYAYAACDDESLLHFLNRFVALFRGVFPPAHPPHPLRLSLYTFITLAFVGTHIISGWLYGWVFRAYNQRRHSSSSSSIYVWELSMLFSFLITETWALRKYFKGTAAVLNLKGTPKIAVSA